MFYSIPEASLCDICENEDCGETCTIRADKQKAEDTRTSGANMQSSSLIQIIVALIIKYVMRLQAVY